MCKQGRSRQATKGLLRPCQNSLKCISMHRRTSVWEYLGNKGRPSDLGNIQLWVLHYLRFAFRSENAMTPALLSSQKATGSLSGKDPSYKRVSLLACNGSITRINNNCLPCSVQGSRTAAVTNTNLSHATSLHRTDSLRVGRAVRRLLLCK